MLPDNTIRPLHGSFQQAIPVPLDDPDAGDQVCVSFARSWLPMVLGSLYQLLQEASYDTSDAVALQLAQDRANTLIYLFQRGVPCLPLPTGEQGFEVDMTTLCDSIRVQNGVLQVLCCGVWENVPGQSSQGVGGPGQPGDGSPVPAPGGCQTYNARMNAKDQWLAPTFVNTGDVITASNLKGAWTSNGLGWWCPNGNEFVANLCVPITDVVGTDPVAAGPHMGLLVKIAGVFHFIGDGLPYTVPGGVVNALLIVQANTQTIGGNSGDITFDLNVCNNQAVTWTHTFDFTTSPRGFIADPGTDGGVYGTWSAGVGWTAADGTEAEGEKLRAAVARLSGIAPFTINSATINYDLTHGPYDTSEWSVKVTANDGVTDTDLINISNAAEVDGTNITNFGAATMMNVTMLDAAILVSTAQRSDPITGSGRIISLTITGSGTEPTWS